jgi:hypothetical protein
MATGSSRSTAASRPMKEFVVIGGQEPNGRRHKNQGANKNA